LSESGGVRTRVKICGITSPEDARLAWREGADAIGLVFHEDSPRYVDIETARRIAVALPPFVLRVGVFVDAPAELMAEHAAAVGLDLLFAQRRPLATHRMSRAFCSTRAARTGARAARVGPSTGRWPVR